MIWRFCRSSGLICSKRIGLHPDVARLLLNTTISKITTMPNLTLKLKNEKIGDFPLQKGVSLTIGRRKKNNVIIQDMSVSGHHAKIDSVGDGFVLIDLQSKNGSFVNEQLINSHWLKNGDTINIGEHSLVFNYSERESVPAENTDELERTIVLDTNQYRSRMRKSNPTRSINNVAGFWDKRRNHSRKKNKQPSIPMGPTNVKKDLKGTLNFLAGGSGQINLTRKYMTIGKHPTSDIVVKGLFMGQTAVTISKMPDGFHLSYVGGLTKPRVNDKVVKQSITLQNEDIIAIGSIKLQFINGKRTKRNQG